jgi:hypothetical protein
MTNNNWTHHFGEKNFSWSNATMVTKGMAPYGVVALGEIERIGQKLIARGNDPTDCRSQGPQAERRRLFPARRLLLLHRRTHGLSGRAEVGDLRQGAQIFQ